MKKDKKELGVLIPALVAAALGGVLLAVSGKALPKLKQKCMEEMGKMKKRGFEPPAVCKSLMEKCCGGKSLEECCKPETEAKPKKKSRKKSRKKKKAK